MQTGLRMPIITTRKFPIWAVPSRSQPEWILDNNYIIRQAISQIKEDLPLGYQKKLPKLSQAPQEGFATAFLP